MSDEVKIKITGEGKEAEKTIDRVENKLEEAGRTAQDTGQQISQAGKAGAVNLESLGQKSEKASAQIVGLSHAVGEFATGRADAQTLALATRELTGTFGDLGDVLSKIGGTAGKLGGVFHAISGVIGPAGVIIAGLTAVYAIWKKINDEAEETARKLEQEIQARLIAAQKEAGNLAASLRQLAQTPSERSEAERGSRVVTAAIQIEPSVVQKIATARSQGLTPDVAAELRAHTLETFQKAAAGDVAQQELAIALLREFKGQLLADAREVADMQREAAKLDLGDSKFLQKQLDSLVDVIRESGVEAGREVLDKVTEAVQRRKQMEQDQAKLSQDMEKKAHQQNKLIEQGTQQAKGLIDVGDTVDEALVKVSDALREEGLGGDGLTVVLENIRRALMRNKTGLEALADSIEQRADQAKAADKQKDDQDHQKEQQKRELDAQRIANEHLDDAVQLWKRFGGDEEVIRSKIVTGLKSVGLDAETVAAIARAMLTGAKERMQQEKQAGQVQRGMAQAGGRETFQQRFEREGKEASGRAGRPLTQAEIKDLREVIGREWRQERQAEREGLRTQQQERRETLEHQFGGRIPASVNRRVRQQEKAEQEELDRRQRHGARVAPAGDDKSVQKFDGAVDKFDQAVRNMGGQAPGGQAAGQGQQPGQRRPIGGPFGQGERQGRDGHGPGQGHQDGRAPDGQNVGRRRPVAFGQAGGLAAQQGGPGGQQAEQAGFDPGQLAQQLQQFGQEQPQTMQEIIGALAQLSVTIANLNTVNRGVRQAARQAIGQLSGPGSRR